MHKYDVTLKNALRRLTGSVLRDVSGVKVARWHNNELPSVQTRRADMLGEAADGQLLHIELQSTNQADMALRMLEYATAIHRQFGRLPRQLVLYVGAARLRMGAQIRGEHLNYRCRIVDLRSLDAEPLIASRRVEDNVISILARLGDERESVRRILRKIARCGPIRRAEALQELTLLAGLRKLEPIIEQEARQMPILNDIMDHGIIGREWKRGRESGFEEGEKLIVLRLIGQRFGPIPDTIRKRIEAMPPSRIEQIAMRIMDAANLEDALREPSRRPGAVAKN